jgi:hypothetical protein
MDFLQARERCEECKWKDVKATGAVDVNLERFVKNALRLTCTRYLFLLSGIPLDWRCPVSGERLPGFAFFRFQKIFEFADPFIQKEHSRHNAKTT